MFLFNRFSHSFPPSRADIGANLTDGMFKGWYHGKLVHSGDLSSVLTRARAHGVEHIMVTAGCLGEVKEAVALVKQYALSEEFKGMLCTTVGVHPTRTGEFDGYAAGADAYMEELVKYVRSHDELNIRAVGEFGLDYDRLHFSGFDVQKKYFEQQFILADESGLPLFLHMRDAAADFISIVRQNRHRFRHGVVHSFTGTADEARQLLDLDLFIGINGWYSNNCLIVGKDSQCGMYIWCGLMYSSLKTPENLQVIQSIPLDRLMVESDAPWCEIRASHAGFTHVKTRILARAKERHSPESPVKSRNEPWACLQVLECLAALHTVPIEGLADQIYNTTINVFGE